MKLIPDGWRWPRIVTHVLDNESTTVTLGFWVFIVASLAAFLIHEGNAHALNSDSWLWCVVLASILVGGKLVTKSLLEAMEMRMGGKPDLSEPEPPAPAAPATPPQPPAGA